MPLSAAGWMLVTEADAFRERFERLVRIVQEDLPRRKLQGLLLLEELLLMLMGEKRPSASPARHEPGIDALLFRMQEAPMAEYNFYEEARRLHLSESHFRRLFRRYTGAAPHDFLLHCRMRHAARLLRESQGQVKAVVSQAGMMHHGHHSSPGLKVGAVGIDLQQVGAEGDEHGRSILPRRLYRLPVVK